MLGEARTGARARASPSMLSEYTVQAEERGWPLVQDGGFCWKLQERKSQNQTINQRLGIQLSKSTKL
jgi:hypothetical protein